MAKVPNKKRATEKAQEMSVGVETHICVLLNAQVLFRRVFTALLWLLLAALPPCMPTSPSSQLAPALDILHHTLAHRLCRAPPGMPAYFIHCCFPQDRAQRGVLLMR